MPWTIPNANCCMASRCRYRDQRVIGYTKLFVYCSNPDCHHNAVLDASKFPDDITYNELHLACSARCAIIAARTCARLGIRLKAVFNGEAQCVPSFLL
jgi:hypothetical protein